MPASPSWKRSPTNLIDLIWNGLSHLDANGRASQPDA